MEKVSIIIPCKEINSFTKKCIEDCLNLDYKDLEIIVLPDFFKNEIKKNKKLRIVKTGDVKPAAKRNKGMKIAKGNFFAFIDSLIIFDKSNLNKINKKIEIPIIGRYFWIFIKITPL